MTNEEIILKLRQQRDDRYLRIAAKEAKKQGKLEGKIEGKLEGKIEAFNLFLEVTSLLLSGHTPEEIVGKLDVPIETVLALQAKLKNKAN